MSNVLVSRVCDHAAGPPHPPSAQFRSCSTRSGSARHARAPHAHCHTAGNSRGRRPEKYPYTAASPAPPSAPCASCGHWCAWCRVLRTARRRCGTVSPQGVPCGGRCSASRTLPSNVPVQPPPPPSTYAPTVLCSPLRSPPRPGPARKSLRRHRNCSRSLGAHHTGCASTASMRGRAAGSTASMLPTRAWCSGRCFSADRSARP
mmetsp:Transcript_4383/g.11258  ORF Transcript_4383/g.11258 Transcript_4383/m.11258 type:complete len:204 (-) Transcript_4383:1404-2015(-)